MTSIVTEYGTFETSAEGTTTESSTQNSDESVHIAFKTNDAYNCYVLTEKAYNQLIWRRNLDYTVGGIGLAISLSSIIYAGYNLFATTNPEPMAGMRVLLHAALAFGVSMAAIKQAIGVDNCLSSMEPYKNYIKRFIPKPEAKCI
ncbi:MAG: hypothetical protein JSR46_05460 [Verrucomicrobia bacterium]|nr:hypothetical protein [Verrucomicrobiota bacterium]